MRIHAFLQQLGCGGEEGAELGLGDFRVDDAQTHTAQSHHRVDFVHLFHPFSQIFVIHATLLGHLALLFLALRDKLMQWRIHQTESEGFAVHHLQRALGGLADVGLQLGQSGLAAFQRVGKNHVAQLLQRFFAVLAIEHVFDTEQADALSTEIQSGLRILRVVGIGADTHRAVFVNNLHELLEERVLGVLRHRNLLSVDPALGAVQTQDVTLIEGFSANLKLAGIEIDLNVIATDDAAFAPSAGDQCGVRGHASTGGQDAVGGTHALHILRIGLLTHKDVGDFLLVIFHGLFAGEGDSADSTAGACGQTFGQNLELLLFGLVQDRMQELVQLGRGDAQHGGLLVNQTLLHHVHSHGQGGDTGALADAALQHEQLALLDGELDIEHVVIVLFKD